MANLAAPKVSRNESRAQFSDASRILLLEQDADQNERDHVAFFNEMRKEQQQTRKAVLALLGAAASSALLLAANLISKQLGI